MMGLAAIAKLAKSGMRAAANSTSVLDQLAEVSSMVGLECDFRLLTPEERAAAFQNAARASLQPGSQVLAVHAADKDGTQFEGIMIVVPKKDVVEGIQPVGLSGGQVLVAPGEATRLNGQK